MKPDRRYIIELVPSKRLGPGTTGPLWYCHRAGWPDVPVFGSIGTKQQAAAVCRAYNLDGKVYYS